MAYVDRPGLLSDYFRRAHPWYKTHRRQVSTLRSHSTAMHLLPSSSDHMNARFTVGLPVPSTIATNNAPPDGAGLLTVPITEYETSIYSLCSTADTAETEKEGAKEKIHSALSKLGCTTNERFEPGQVLYSVCTPDTTAKIQKLHSSFDNDNYTLAEIEYHKFSSTILNFGGEEFKARNFFEKRMISKLCCHRRLERIRKHLCLLNP